MQYNIILRTHKDLFFFTLAIFSNVCFRTNTLICVMDKC